MMHYQISHPVEKATWGPFVCYDLCKDKKCASTTTNRDEVTCKLCLWLTGRSIRELCSMPHKAMILSADPPEKCAKLK